MKIAVYGKLRAGKTAVCDYIKSNSPNWEILDFGDALKECVAIAYPESVNRPKNRELLISFGQHLRKLDEDIWVNALKHRILNTFSDHILVTGVRQQNEYDMLKKQGFIFIRVEADREARIERCKANGDIFKEENLEDPTELAMDNFEADYTILNNRGFKELEISIRNVMADIIVKDMTKRFKSDTAKFLSKELK